MTGLLGRRGVVENSIEIKATPEAVFDYCTDTLREPEWNPKLLEVEKLTAGPIGLGTRFRIRIDRVGWSNTENIAFRRPSFWAATSASRWLDVRIEFEVTPTERAARLSVRALLLPHGVLRLGNPIFRPDLEVLPLTLPQHRQRRGDTSHPVREINRPPAVSVPVAGWGAIIRGYL